MDDLLNLLRAMAQHTQDNPSHGFNCACKDEFTRRIGVIIRSEPGLRREFELVATYIMRSPH